MNNDNEIRPWIFYVALCLSAFIISVATAPFTPVFGYLVPIVLIYWIIVDRQQGKVFWLFLAIVLVYDAVLSGLFFGISSGAIMSVFIISKIINRFISVNVRSTVFSIVIGTLLFVLFCGILSIVVPPYVYFSLSFSLLAQSVIIFFILSLLTRSVKFKQSFHDR